MTTRTVGCWLALTAMLVNSTAPVWAQGVVAPVPPAPQPTLWSFLGIPQAFKAVREGAINRSGNRPGLEKKPPLKKIADPANLVSENPAIKKAAEIKKEEDLKWQKIKAIKYLTTIGCGCYNRDGSITDALMKAMDDCTEEVRYATILAINGAAGGEMCENCKMRSCCSEEVSNKLYELAYERDDEGCFLEPSERVRLAAAEALRVCCPGRGDDFFFESAPPAAIPQGGEQPGVVPLPGGERPLDAPPLPPGEPTPAPPMPPVPPPTLRPISEPLPPRNEVQPQLLQRQEEPRDRVAVQSQPPIEVTAKELPRHQIRVSEPRRTEIRVSEAPRVIAPSPIITRAEAPPRTTVRPATATPIINPTIPAASKPAEAEPAPEPGKQQSSRRTANLPPAAKVEIAAKTSNPVPPVSLPSDGSARVSGLPSSTTTPHWTVGAKAPTVFISKPIEPARPIEPAKTNAPPARPAMTTPTTAENLAPVVPASAMRRLPPPSDEAPSPTPATTVDSTGAKAKFASQRLPAPLPVSKNPPAKPRELPGDRFGAGTIGSVRPNDGVVLIEFESSQTVPTGSIIRAYHQGASAVTKSVGDLEVVHSKGNVAVAVPYNGSQLRAFNIGDQAFVLR